MTRQRLLLVTLLVMALLETSTSSSRHLRMLKSGIDSPENHAHRKLQLTCNIQRGVDYVGNDIRSASNRPVSACCDECAATPGCFAWSWNAWNGGTCWLKSSKGQIATNPNVQSAEFQMTAPSCPITVSVDYVGNDIANVQASPAGACCDICKGWVGCNAFSWTSYNGGTCWLKSKKDQTVANPNVQSGDVSGTSDCVLEQGIDYYDNDIANVAGYPDPGACCEVCLSWSGCRAFSWTNLNGGTCWLKSIKGATRQDPNVVSCSVLPDSPPSCALERNVDYVDNDITSVRNGDPDNCCYICSFYQGCRAFSWSDFNGGTCWLKSAKGVTTSKTGVISGVM